MFLCRSPCRPASTASDCVKISTLERDLKLDLAEQPERAGDKERQRKENDATAARFEEERQLALRRLLEAENQRQRQEEQKQLEEQRQQEQQGLLEEQRALGHQAAAVNEEWLKCEAKEKERVQREEAEKERLRAQHRRVCEDIERRQALQRFYKQHGFAGVNAPRRSGCAIFGHTTTYPLHCAAELGNVRIVEMLLKEGAKRTQKNSAGRTAMQVAKKKVRAGGQAHQDVLHVLSVEAPQQRTDLLGRGALQRGSGRSAPPAEAERKA